VKDLVFEYPGVRALDSVSLTVRQGEISALVGPNGAGKTTLMRCMAGLARPVSGSISIDGLDVLEQPRKAHLKMGYLADFFGLYTNLSVRQCLQYAARSHFIAPGREGAAVRQTAERLGLSDRLDVRAGTLSRGLSQRLAIAQAMVHEPGFLILDEPASGLDPEARKSLSELFLDLKQQGITLLVSSHILSELEEYSDNMIIVRHGRIVEHADVSNKSGAATHMIVEVSRLDDGMQAWLQQQPGISDVVVQGSEFRFQLDTGQSSRQALLQEMVTHGWEVQEYRVEKKNLHDAYLERVSSMDKEAGHGS
jgi:ABC-2 type transport system ATP-binding protein